jgi:CBS domain-containing protein
MWVMAYPVAIRARQWRSHDGLETCHLTVLCPMRGYTVEIGTCQECPHAQGIHAGLGDPERHVLCRAARLPSSRAALVHEIMHKDVLCVSSDMPAYDVRGMLLEGSVDLVPVADGDGTLRGVVTKTDMLRAARLAAWTSKRVVSWLDFLATRHEARLRDAEDTMSVAEVMTPSPTVVEESARLVDTIERFVRDHVRVLPVVAAGGALVGTLDVTDLFAGMR